jgi:predicted DNA-binding transcriptional regulator YafY
MGIWDGQIVEFEYKNHRGEIGTRRVKPLVIWFGHTEWHPEDQYLLKAWCLDRQEPRDFAMVDIHAWRKAEDQSLPWR